ncbi:MAG: hypothetical protein K2I22_14695 [Lachnospiraceae bacterium]|nr:hypothetical protein [Lachnospiraceae bacterium]
MQSIFHCKIFTEAAIQYFLAFEGANTVAELFVNACLQASMRVDIPLSGLLKKSLCIHQNQLRKKAANLFLIYCFYVPL